MIAVDALALLLFIEATIILLAASVLLAFRVRKYSRLRQQAVEELSEARKELEKLRSAVPAAPVSSTVPIAAGLPDGDALPKTVEMLTRIVREILTCKAVFDTSPGRLSAVQAAYRELEGKTAAGPAGAAVSDRPKQSEMEATIGALKAEQETLAVKFRIWEGQFDKIKGGSPASAESADDVDAIVRSMMTSEKKELLARLQSAEDALREKAGLLEAVQKKYNNLEKEYEILYRQQQNQSS